MTYTPIMDNLSSGSANYRYHILPMIVGPSGRADDLKAGVCPQFTLHQRCLHSLVVSADDSKQELVSMCGCLRVHTPQ